MEYTIHKVLLQSITKRRIFWGALPTTEAIIYIFKSFYRLPNRYRDSSNFLKRPIGCL